MESKRSQTMFPTQVVLPIILNLILFLIHDVSGNAQILVTNFPVGTTNASYPNENSVQIRMLGGFPTANNQLVCSGFTLTSDDQFWIKEIKPVVNSAISNNIRMNLYGCSYVPTNPCSCALISRSLVFSWTAYNPPIRFDSKFSPTGFNVGGDSQIKLLFIEVRYLTTISSPDFSNGFDLQITRVRPLYVASMYTVLLADTAPALKNYYYLDACVTIPSIQPYPIRTLAYRVNSGNYGQLVSGYIQSSTTGAITEIGRGNPNFPQAFYVTQQSYFLNAGDTIMVRCVFNSGTSFTTTYRQSCNFNILWLMPNLSPASTTTSFLNGTCTAAQSSSIPIEATHLLPDNTILDLQSLYGNQTGIVTIDSTHSVNLDKETFTAIYP